MRNFSPDPETKQRKYFADLEALLAWWVNHCGAEKVMQFATVQLCEARELLGNGRTPAVEALKIVRRDGIVGRKTDFRERQG